MCTNLLWAFSAFVCPPLCLFAIDTFHGYSSVSQQPEIVASLLTVKQVLLGKNVQKDVSYFFGCSVDLLKCLENMFVFSNKDFHTCNLTDVIFTYFTQFMSC